VHTVTVNTQSDFSPDSQGLERALKQLIDFRNGTVIKTRIPALPTGLPNVGIGGRAAMEQLAPWALDSSARLDAPGFIAHMDPPTPWMTWASALWMAGTNQNLLHPDAAPVASDLEQKVIEWLAPWFGMTGGHMVPDSTLGNLTALWAARDVAGVKRIVTSADAHLSVEKAARILGMPIEFLTVDETRALRADQLDMNLSDAALVLTAGTTAVGAVDCLKSPRRAAWVHVDAAWAGPLRLTRYAAVLDGIENADSVVVSAHKWLYQPKESALIFFAQPDRVADALTFGDTYLAKPNVGLLGSHGATALPLLATLLSWGLEGLRERIESDMGLAQCLAERVQVEPTLELWAPPKTGVVVWRTRRNDPLKVREHLRDHMEGAWVSTAKIDGQVWLRSVAANPFADPDKLIDAVLSAEKSLLSNLD
jgi:L-2,4-diaminobutyrate decarboxylase